MVGARCSLLVPLLILPLLGQQCEDRIDITLHEFDYVYVEALTSPSLEDVMVVRGALLDARVEPQRAIFFVEPFCQEWTHWPQKLDCLQRRAVLSLIEGETYTITGWTRAEDRRDPQRELIRVHEQWTCCE